MLARANSNIYLQNNTWRKKKFQKKINSKKGIIIIIFNSVELDRTKDVHLTAIYTSDKLTSFVSESYRHSKV